MAKEIPLTKGFRVLVSDEDYDWLSKHKWYALHRHSVVLAARRKTSEGANRGERGYQQVYMGREILGLANAHKGSEALHLNGNHLDCRRENLRARTTGAPKRRSSQYRGVTFHGMSGQWMSRIRSKGRQLYLGLYKTEEEAARAYDKAAWQLFGATAWLNFPEEFD